MRKNEARLKRRQEKATAKTKKVKQAKKTKSPSMKRKKRVEFPFLCERQGLIEERMFSVWIKHQIGDERVEPIIKLLRDLGAFKFVDSGEILGTIQIQTGMRMMAYGKSKRDEETLKACLEEMAVRDEKIAALKLYEKFYNEILSDEPLFHLN